MEIQTEKQESNYGHQVKEIHEQIKFFNDINCRNYFIWRYNNLKVYQLNLISYYNQIILRNKINTKYLHENQYTQYSMLLNFNNQQYKYYQFILIIHFMIVLLNLKTIKNLIGKAILQLKASLQIQESLI
ncbi:unnamed protein product [Paramecium octaurelia]|uniref:Uncharacterized protein n=1 Tax=Paramecium octaurelia TaxID=43137 RepID=A0A8S1Y5D6_PAROT|nr:unnamed protein product [Paramecium octaurelia]